MQRANRLAKAAGVGNLFLWRRLIFKAYALLALEFPHSALQHHTPATAYRARVDLHQLKHIHDAFFTELFGNLLDNARKWANSRVKIRLADGLLTIEDDGPGVPEANLGQISERGQRFDETKQGSGLGLSIVEDIADSYNLAIDYDRSELGGLRVTIRV